MIDILAKQASIVDYGCARPVSRNNKKSYEKDLKRLMKTSAALLEFATIKDGPCFDKETHEGLMVIFGDAELSSITYTAKDLCDLLGRKICHHQKRPDLVNPL